MKLNILTAGIAMALMQEAPGEAGKSNGGAATGKAPKFAKKEYDMDTRVLSVEFGNGTTLELDLNDVPQETQIQLMLHGAAQKVGDSFAGAKGNFNVGIEAARGVIEQLKAGEWRGAGDEARPRLAELAAAIARIKGAPLEKATAAVEAATDDQRKQWRSNPQVKATIAQMRAEKAAKQLEGQEQQEVNITL